MFCYETFMKVTKWQYKIHINSKKKKSSCVQTFSAKFWHAYRHSTTKVKL